MRSPRRSFQHLEPTPQPARSPATQRALIRGTAAWPKLQWVIGVQGALMAGAVWAMHASTPSIPTSATLVRGAVVLSGVVTATAWCIHILNKRHEKTMRRINEVLEDEVRERYADALFARNAIILALAKVADGRDTDSGTHVQRIASYSEAIARELSKDLPEVDAVFVEHVRLGALMHDIGKMGVPDAVLLKPCRLSPDERSIMEMHTTYGAQTLEESTNDIADDALLAVCRNIVRSHHERWDGAGYPDKLAGESIPLEARIVALADVYDALTSQRVYKSAMPHAKAVKIIAESSSSHFDPRIVKAFFAVQQKFEAIHAQWKEPHRLSLAA